MPSHCDKREHQVSRPADSMGSKQRMGERREKETKLRMDI